MLIPFHVVTGCDHPSGFNRYGKKSMFENLQKDHGVQHLLQKFRESLKFSDDVRDDVRRFVLLIICRGKETNYTEAKAAKIRKMKKKSLVRLLLMNLLHIITWIKLL